MEGTIIPALAIGLSLGLAILGTLVCFATLAIGLTYWSEAQDAKGR